MNEEQKFLSWLEAEKADGLIDVKFYPVNTETADKEAIYTELNAINNAKLEGKFSRITDL